MEEKMPDGEKCIGKREKELASKRVPKFSMI